MQNKDILLEVINLKKYFQINSNVLKSKIADNKAIDGLNLKIYKNTTLGLIGESGCGKSTTGKCLLNLFKPTEGKIFYHKNKKKKNLSKLKSK